MLNNIMDEIGTDQLKSNFFQHVKNSNVTEILSFFRSDNIKPWLFKEEEEYTALHRAAFMDLTLIITLMLDEMKRKLGIEAKDEIRKWINSQSEQGYTALHYAAYRGNIEIINKLIENGGQVEIVNKRGLNVLHMSAQGNQPGSLLYFKEKYSIDIHSIDDMGSTPLHWACYTGSEDAVVFLLSWNPEINTQDREGLTPIHLAIMSDRTRIIKKLINKGADIYIKDLKGRTAFDLAYDKNKLTIVNLLKNNNNCRLCNFKPPLGKVEKTKEKILIFYVLHITISFVMLFYLLPFINLKSVALIYIIMILLIWLVYIILIISNPGILSKEDSKILIRLVEKSIKINNFCPICAIEKSQRSKHCIICNVCVEDFDHHCFWVNNCIGRNNISTFIFFLVILNLNILSNIIIAFTSFFYNITNVDNVFPPLLLQENFYGYYVKITIATIVIIIGIIFLIPTIGLLCLQFKNGYLKFKLNNRLRTSLTSTDERSIILLQNVKSNDDLLRKIGKT